MVYADRQCQPRASWRSQLTQSPPRASSRIVDARDHADCAHDMPVLFDEAWGGAEIGRDLFGARLALTGFLYLVAIIDWATRRVLSPDSPLEGSGFEPPVPLR
jgi:hypothetical protein